MFHRIRRPTDRLTSPTAAFDSVLRLRSHVRCTHRRQGRRPTALDFVASGGYMGSDVSGAFKLSGIYVTTTRCWNFCGHSLRGRKALGTAGLGRAHRKSYLFAGKEASRSSREAAIQQLKLVRYERGGPAASVCLLVRRWQLQHHRILPIPNPKRP